MPTIVSPERRVGPSNTLKSALRAEASVVVVVVVVGTVVVGTPPAGGWVVGVGADPSPDPPAATATPPPTTAAPPTASAAVAPAPRPAAAPPAKPAGRLGKTATVALLTTGATGSFEWHSDALATTSASASGVRLSVKDRSNAST